MYRCKNTSSKKIYNMDNYDSYSNHKAPYQKLQCEKSLLSDNAVPISFLIGEKPTVNSGKQCNLQIIL